jgi:hypothetical protein
MCREMAVTRRWNKRARQEEFRMKKIWELNSNRVICQEKTELE